MDKYQQILIDYANNRKALKAIKAEITTVVWSEGKGIDISDFREEWYGEPGEYDGGQPKWEGWTVAVGAFDHTPEQLVLAKLPDKRNEINRKAGQLKRNMCAYGRGLMASTGTDGL